MSVSALQNRLKLEIESALDEATRFSDCCPVRLSEAMRYSLLAPGKRLRPILVIISARLCTEKSSAKCSELADSISADVMRAACAVEMIHAYSLIHDDLPAMDNDDMRRGRLTCHRQFDEPTAILAGDALLTLAFEQLASISPSSRAARCCYELAVASGASQLIGGQMDDISREKKIGGWNATPEEMMEKIHLRKTAALIQVSLRLGAILAGTDESLEESLIVKLDEFGRHFGLAFQITDDILDAIGDENLVGKRLRKDAEQEKWSYTNLLGLDGAKKAAENAIKNAENILEASFGDEDIHSESSYLDILRNMTRSLINRTV